MSATRVCSTADLAPGTALRVELPTGPVAVVRDDDGDFHAIEDVCTHGQVALSDGDVEGATIECWLHGSTFDLNSGKPLSLPATRPVPVYLVTIEGDSVLVDAAVTIN